MRDRFQMTSKQTTLVPEMDQALTHDRSMFRQTIMIPNLKLYSFRIICSTQTRMRSVRSRVPCGNFMSAKDHDHHGSLSRARPG